MVFDPRDKKNLLDYFEKEWGGGPYLKGGIYVPDDGETYYDKDNETWYIWVGGKDGNWYKAYPSSGGGDWTGLVEITDSCAINLSVEDEIGIDWGSI